MTHEAEPGAGGGLPPALGDKAAGGGLPPALGTTSDFKFDLFAKNLEVFAIICLYLIVVEVLWRVPIV